MNTDLIFPSLLLHLLPGIGPVRYQKLVDHYSNPRLVLEEADIDLFNEDAQALVRDYRQKLEHSELISKAKQVIEKVEKSNASILLIDDPDYPPLLKEITSPAPLLYVKGNAENLSLPQIAVVGSRKATASGIRNTQLFSYHLAKGGFCITSGLALGIDGIAHEAALKAKQKTIAVTATGIDVVYPRKHDVLANQIIEQDGIIISEYPPSTKPNAENFPRRNRIISGLSLGVLVIEAAIRSGSLITARYAVEQNREVFAIPGSIHNPQSRGCHELIRQGATLVETADDMISQLNGPLNRFAVSSYEAPPSKEPNNDQLNEYERLIMEQLAYDVLSSEQLLLATSLSYSQICEHLLSLEIKQKIRFTGVGYERV